MKKRIWCALLCAVLALSLAVPSFAAYRDVPAGHWAAGDIQYVTERGLFKGTGGDTFDPSTEMSRAMLATVLYRYAGSPAVWETVLYSDVALETWYAPGVAWAYQNRIFPSANLERGLLYPNENVRRAEFCVMLYRFAQSLGKADADPSAVNRAPFTDMEWNRFSMAGFGPLYNEAAEAMLGWAWPMGIMEGTSATTINPLGTITRAEVAAMLARFDRNVLGGTEPTVQQTPSPTPDPNPTPTDNGYTTADGKPLTEENVRAAIVALKEIYPDGTVYPTPYCSSDPLNRPYSNCDACAGWAMLCSDAAFGSLPWRYQVAPDWDDIRIGDLIRYSTAHSGHVVVVIDKTDDYIKVTESGTHNKALWGVSAPVRFCNFSPNKECKKTAGKGVQPLNNYTCRFRPSSLNCTDKSGLDGLQADKWISG